MKIKIKYHGNPKAKVEKIAIGDWVDLRAAYDSKTAKNGED